MSSIKKNVVANFAGSAWTGLMGVIFVPIYIRLMGVESYGVIGIFASLQAMFAVLDLGLSQALAREMARLSVDQKNTNRMADTARTLEIIYWGIALVVIAVITVASHFIAYHWLNPEKISREYLLEVLWIMALVVGLRWPVSLYMGGLNGLQRQVLVNSVLAIFATLQGAGAVAVLWLIQPTVQTFFFWQALMALAQVIVLRIALWRNLSSERKGMFRGDVLKEIWRFAAGMTGISLVSTILMQTDKILLSKLLSLSDFGYYTFAATVAAVLYRLIAPVFTAYYPRLTELVSKDDQPGLVRTYHQGCQFMAVVILPSALTLAFFSKEVLSLWVRDPGVIAHASLLVSLLVIGNTLHGFMHLPYALQLAHGWTKLSFSTNLVAVIFFAPAIYFSTMAWGTVGAASMWIVLNIGYLLIVIQLMHLRLLKHEKWSWYRNDVGKLLAITLAVTGVGRLIMRDGLEDILKFVILMIVFGVATLSTVMGTAWLRDAFKIRRIL
ncbi:MAG: oligosaccharide flippase family protein [Bacteroidota bacterium]